MNTLVLTSCNRIEQVLLSIAVNKDVIKEPFNLIVVDCSTPHLSAKDAIAMHCSDDPHNLVDYESYSPNYELLEPYIKTIEKIKSYKVIHISPRMNKQVGDAYLSAIGLMGACLMGSKYVLKLTGVCQLKYDVFSNFQDQLISSDVISWKRSSFHDQLSTRIFLGESTNLSIALLKAGYNEWVLDYDFLEFKFRKVIKDLRHFHTDLDEANVLIDGGFGKKYTKETIALNLKKYNIL
jgi:hypothetical protein